MKRVFGNILLFGGVLVALCGLLGAFLLCAFVLEEYMNGFRIIGDWQPNTHDPVAFYLDLPANLWTAMMFFPWTCLITFVFSPLVLIFVPPIVGFSYGDWSIVILGWGPFFAGIAMFIWGGLMREGTSAKKAPKIRKRPVSRSGPGPE